MRKAPTLPRYVDPASVQIGDVIRVAWEAGGIQHTRTARVARRDYEGQVRVLYTTEGTEIMHWVPGVRSARITLIEAAPVPADPFQDLLASLDNWEKAV